MVEITDEFMKTRLAQARDYCLVQLKIGPNYRPRDVRSPEQARIIWEHGRRNMRLREERIMPMVGPVSGAEPLVGMCIFAVPEAEARALMAEDPAVKAGIFLAEYAQWSGGPGDRLPD